MPPIKNKILALVLLFLCSVQVQSQTKKPSRKAKKARVEAQRSSIIATAKDYIGTKYRYGGNAPGGFDCSGFVEYVYGKNGIDVPRVCLAQKKAANKKRSTKLKPGDLVFFGKWKVKHVGIVVLSSAEELVMIHASNSNGVTITNVFDSAYWKRRLKGGGSYLN